MNLSTNGKMLLARAKELSLRWEETKQSWQDAKSAEFEQHFLSEMLVGVERTVEVFDRLEKLVSKVRSECE